VSAPTGCVTRAAKTGSMQDSLAAALVPRSRAMARECLVRCQVSDEAKGLLQRIAAQRQITESAFVRQLIEAMVQMATDAKIAERDASKRAVREGRLYVRLAPENRILLNDRATPNRLRQFASLTYYDPRDTLVRLRAIESDPQCGGGCKRAHLHVFPIQHGPADGSFNCRPTASLPRVRGGSRLDNCC
jgi:hypothetical protein